MFRRKRSIGEYLTVIIQVNVRAIEYRAAVQAILEFGDSAIGDLEKLLDHRDPVVRHRAQELLSQIDRIRTARNRFPSFPRPADFSIDQIPTNHDH